MTLNFSLLSLIILKLSIFFRITLMVKYLELNENNLKINKLLLLFTVFITLFQMTIYQITHKIQFNY